MGGVAAEVRVEGKQQHATGTFQTESAKGLPAVTYGLRVKMMGFLLQL